MKREYVVEGESKPGAKVIKPGLGQGLKDRVPRHHLRRRGFIEVKKVARRASTSCHRAATILCYAFLLFRPFPTPTLFVLACHLTRSLVLSSLSGTGRGKYVFLFVCVCVCVCVWILFDVREKIFDLVCLLRTIADRGSKVSVAFGSLSILCRGSTPSQTNPLTRTELKLTIAAGTSTRSNSQLQILPLNYSIRYSK